ncbi:Pyruvate formate-lyase 1-activating enzyme [Pluralibacter gergoviae]|nr:Pyruvate formate-lyase 1-activating enzyme [Pluralibacter gergoviae]
MRYHQYYPVDIVNGPGTRCTLFVSGCVHECPGCYNKSTWRLNSGQPFTQEMEDRIIADLNDTRVKRQGVSLSGGDPLHPAKRRGYSAAGQKGARRVSGQRYLGVDRL